jgi:pimeloyl-ACP methyl ester carboxylesterase
MTQRKRVRGTLGEFAEIPWRGAPVRIEYERVGRADPDAPLVVFLHEGLGSISTWRDFPARLCEAAGARGLAFSRPGYGRSTLPRGEAHREADYLHRQAFEVLPRFLEAVGGYDRAPWLFGHSDGGTIALLHAARFPERTAGSVVVAPHIFVEDRTIAGLERARAAWLAADVRTRLARHHEDPDWVFWSWNDTWLDPRFRQWSIERELATIRCPVLAVQGVADEYGTLEQVRGIARRVPGARVLELAGAGHAPQRDEPEALVAAAARFISSGGA